MCPGSLLSFLRHKPQITHYRLGKTQPIPKDGLWGPVQWGPKFCCRCPPACPALGPSQPLSAPPQTPFLFQDPSPPSGPSSSPQHPAPPANGGNSQGETYLTSFPGCAHFCTPHPSSRPHALISAGPTLGLGSSIYQLSWLHHELLLQGRDHLLPTCVTHPRQSRSPAHRADILTEGPGPGATKVAAEITSNGGGEG